MTTHVLGVRHHGPGSARSVVAALERTRPDVVLVEGPPDADDVLALASEAAMRPPVALLVHVVENPERAVFYPFARFSPEWVAMRWALGRGLPVRFMDLPIAHQLAPGFRVDRASGDPVRDDPIGALGRAAGYADPEAWWEHQIEQRLDPEGVFDAILEAMTALRDGRPSGEEEQKREAAMRRILRKAEKEFGDVAVVCGAWHAPALVARPTSKADDAALKGLAKAKVAATWIPWTSSRLAYASGYGAGVDSPAFYDLVWEAGAGAKTRWVARAARLLRDDGIDASPAMVIDGVRLAEALAALSGRAQPGIDDLRDAVRATLAAGDGGRLATIRRRLEVGDAIGEVASSAILVPLQRDLAAQQKTLRLRPSAETKALDLDLREPFARARSRLLHRLAILGVPWGEPEEAVGKSGTFHELWTLTWTPEHAVALIEASVYGSTIAAAASGRAKHEASKLDTLAAVTKLLEAAVLADLPDGIGAALDRLSALSALAHDVVRTMAALPPLVRVLRWGDVRETDASRVLPIVEAMFDRIVIGLGAACAALDDEAAKNVLSAIEATHGAVRLLDREGERATWIAALEDLAGRDVHGLVRGGAVRLLLEQKALDAAELGRRARLALAPAAPPAAAAAWLEGVVRGSAAVLVHQDELWDAMDGWIASLGAETFQEQLPLVRRAFAAFDGAARRMLAERVARGARKETARSAARLDEGRSSRVRPVLGRLLGVDL